MKTKPRSTIRFTETVLDDTWIEFQKALKQVPFSLWNESTFRWFFSRSARKLFPKVKMHIEWKHFDLLATLGARNYLIEFKFFVPNRCVELDELRGQWTRGKWKGGPGSNNLKEFKHCVDRLKEADSKYAGEHVRFRERSVVMVFPDRPDWNGMTTRSYREHYCPLKDTSLQELLREREPLRLLKQDCDIDGELKPLDLYCKRFDLR